MPPNSTNEPTHVNDRHSTKLYPSGFRCYPTDRDAFPKSSHGWLAGKRVDDAVWPYWRVHDKLYDLAGFVDNHPGGRDWIRDTQGTDITEAFESAHIGPLAERVLAKYEVGQATGPRVSPYTFHEHGFYRTFKRKAWPILKKVGTGPNRSMLLLQDSLAVITLSMALTACLLESYTLAVLAGILISLTTNCAHNFFHQRDNWRMYLFDLSLLSSHEWRVSHGLSHHIFTNTFYDLEISGLEPYISFLPDPNKNFLQRYGVRVYTLLLAPLLFYIELLRRLCSIVKGTQKVRPENLIPFVELLVMCAVTTSFATGLRLWAVMHLGSSAWFVGLGVIVAHHHPDIYHEGDTMRTDPDWGLCQLDAVRDRIEVKGNLLLVCTTFGDHSLHHLLPTVDHSKLPHLYPAFLETCEQFGVPFQFTTQWELAVGTWVQLANIRPNPNPPGYKAK